MSKHQTPIKQVLSLDDTENVRSAVQNLEKSMGMRETQTLHKMKSKRLKRWYLVLEDEMKERSKVCLCLFYCICLFVVFDCFLIFCFILISRYYVYSFS